MAGSGKRKIVPQRDTSSTDKNGLLHLTHKPKIHFYYIPSSGKSVLRNIDMLTTKEGRAHQKLHAVNLLKKEILIKLNLER